MRKMVGVVLASLAACTSGGGGQSVQHSTTSVVARPTSNAAPRPRQMPSTTATTKPQSPLVTSLDALVANTNSCLIVINGTTGAVLYDHLSDLALAPASTQKLLVAAAALDRLGARYRFTTEVVAARAPVAGEVNDLWIVGGGDPLLASPEYAAYLQSNPATAGYPTTPLGALADALIARGVRTVRGGIHGDDTRYQPPHYLPTWPADLNQGEFDVGPLSALEVDQGLGSWRPDIVAPDPTGHGSAVLARLLGQRGATSAQAPDQPRPAAGVVLAQVQSAPLADIVSAMLRASDNQIAELLVRELDRQAGGQGTTSGGVRVVTAEAARLGVHTAGLSLVDGSGLSAVDRVSCRTLLDALDLGDQPRFSTLVTGLAVAGVSGTMFNLFRGTPIAGRLAAKGGYITGVSALVGRLSGSPPLRFAFVTNGAMSFAQGLALEERLVAVLAA